MTTAAKYRKKPVEIEAWLVTDDVDDNDALLEWIGDNAYLDDDDDIAIETLEGIMTARTGDYIIRGVQGEFYPCKPDIFAATYEAVTETINRGPWARFDNLPPIGSKLVAGNTGKVIYKVIEHRQLSSRGEVRLKDTRTGKSVGWHYPNYYRYVTEAVSA